MNRSNVIKALLICFLIWFPVYILFLISTAHLMMVTEATTFSYIASAVFWGAVEALPFLILIHKSAYTKGKKAVFSCAAMLTGALLFFLSAVLM